MTDFLDIDEAPFAGSTLIIDVDGTLVPDRAKHLTEETVAKLRRLARTCDVYLCSNGSPDSAVLFAAQAGVRSFPAFKPFPGKAVALMRGGGRLVVIGDKYLTDGIFASVLGAEFIKIEPMRSEHDGRFARFSYALDAFAWRTAPFLLVLRPRQWIKNLLIFAPLFFAGLATHLAVLKDVALGFLLFSLTASAMYVLNDIVDVHQDRLHPQKRLRPIASGRLSVFQARLWCAATLALAMLTLFFIPILVVPIIAYVVLNIAYSAWLKHIAVVDIMCVAIFYMLRLVAGGLAATVSLSPWIVLCALFGALFVVTGKRRAEVQRTEKRAVLEHYSPHALDFMLSASAALAIMAYGIYSVIGHTSTLLVYSTGFVLFALFRMLNRMYTHPEDAETPEHLVFKDPWILGAFIGWVLYVAWIFYVL